MISFAIFEFMFRFLPVFLIVYYAFPAKTQKHDIADWQYCVFMPWENLFLSCYLFF